MEHLFPVEIGNLENRRVRGLFVSPWHAVVQKFELLCLHIFYVFFFCTLTFSPYHSSLCFCQNDLPKEENLIPIPLLTLLHGLPLPPRKKFRGYTLKVSSVIWCVSSSPLLMSSPFLCGGCKAVLLSPNCHIPLPALSSSLFTWRILPHLGWRKPRWRFFSKPFLLPPCPASGDWVRWPSHVLTAPSACRVYPSISSTRFSVSWEWGNLVFHSNLWNSWYCEI